MKFSEIKELIDLVDTSNLSYFEVKTQNDYIKMDKSLDRNNKSIDNIYNEKELCISNDNINKEIKNDNEVIKNISNKDDSKDNGENFDYIESPMVGTFYEASSPDAKPFAIKGQKVSKGEVLCIVEAMKLMNEIVAEFDCEIVDVLVENSDMVEYAQPIFKIRR